MWFYLAARIKEDAVGPAAPPTVVLDLAEADNPFKGLRPFDEADAANFFGHETLIQQLLARMGEGEGLARFLAAVEPSSHTGILNSVDVSPDGRFLCTASGDSSVRLWSIDYQGTVDALCSRLRRDFTAEERAQFGIPQGATCGALS